jgi:hypothetical protein
MDTIALNPLFIQTTLDGNIHEIVLLKASKEAVDRWFEAMQDICRQQSSGLGKYLIDLRAESQPVAYMMRRMETLIEMYPSILEDRIAFLHNQSFPVALVQTQLKNMGGRPKQQISFFPQKDRNRAIEWLKS